MTAVNQNFSMYAGETKNIIVPITNDDGSNLDLTGASIKWVVKKRASATTNDILKQTPDITTSSNEMTIKLVPSDTQNLLGTYYHECELMDQQNNVSTVFVGWITIIQSGI